PRRPLAGFVRGGFAPGEGDVDWRAASDVFGVVEIAGIEHENFVGRSGGAERNADKDAALFGVHGDPERVAELPVDLVPGGLNFLGNFDGLAAAEDVETGAVGDDHPVFTDADAADGGRANFVRDFRDGPERRLVGAVVLGDVERMFFYEV